MNIRKRIVLLSIFILLTTTIILVVRYRYQQISKGFISHTSHLSQRITREMRFTADYLTTLSQSSQINEYVSDRQSIDKKNKVQQLFASTIIKSPSYDQVRYIDESGYESIRVNYRDSSVSIAPENFHQQKNVLFYFTDTMKLKKGEVYLSPLDLNVEQGQIEVPHVPIIRMSMPIFDSAGNPKGIIVVNYRTGDILNELSTHGDLNDYISTYLVNSDGYWIKGPTPDSEWGFKFAERTREKFEKYYPLTHKTIESKDSGDLVNKEGIFFWVKFFPIEDIKPKNETTNSRLFYYSRYLATKDFHLTIIAHSSPSQMLRYLLKRK